MHRIMVVALAGVAACTARDAAPGGAGAGEVAVQWSGKSRGSLRAAATARWCGADTLLEVVAVHGDTSFGLALIAQDSVGAVAYPVNETRMFTPGRPQANVALRLLKEFELEGYDAMSGRVTVTQGGSRVVSGTIDVRMRPVVGADTFQLTGSFERLPVTLATGTCGRANKPGGG